jgi:hypothetical protein
MKIDIMSNLKFMNPNECLSVIDDDACNAIYYVNVNFTNV